MASTIDLIGEEDDEEEEDGKDLDEHEGKGDSDSEAQESAEELAAAAAAGCGNHVPISHGAVRSMALLLAKGADVDATDTVRCCPVSLVCASPAQIVVAVCVQTGNTALLWSGTYDIAPMVRLLIMVSVFLLILESLIGSQMNSSCMFLS